LRPRERAGALGEVLGTQQLSANRAREQVVGDRGGSGEETRKTKRSQTALAGLGRLRIEQPAGER
jgi:hypothetical protein